MKTVFHGMILFLFLMLVNCVEKTEAEDSETGDDMATDKRSVTADMFTSGSPTATVPANPVPSLQVFGMEPGPYTLRFSVIAPAPVGGIVATAAVATIAWKLDGQQFNRQISVVNGAALSSQAEGVDVKLQDISGPFGINLASGRKYQIVAAVAKGIRSPVETPPYLCTTPPFSLVAGASKTIAVPQDAGVISTFVNVQITPAPVASTDIFDVVVSPQVTGSIADQFFPLVVNDWVPILPSADSIIITNTSGAKNALITVYFGIEG